MRSAFVKRRLPRLLAKVPKGARIVIRCCTVDRGDYYPHVLSMHTDKPYWQDRNGERTSEYVIGRNRQFFETLLRMQKVCKRIERVRPDIEIV